MRVSFWRPILLWRSFLSLLVVSCVLYASEGRAGEPTAKFKIGLIAPLTGPLADAGEALKNSALLAREEFDKENRVEFIVDDDNFNAQKAVTIAKRMIEIDKVSAFMVFGSGSALSVADIAEKSKVPMFAICLSDKVTLNRQYVFRYFLTAGSIARTLAQEIERRNYSGIALITSQQEGMISIRDAFLALKHPPILTQDEVFPNETDFKTISLKIKSAQAPAAVALTFGYQAAILAKQLRASKYTGEIASGPPLQIPSIVKGAEGALEGTWIATMDDDAGAGFFERYKSAYKIDAVPDGTYSYDAARLLIHGVLSGDILKFLNETTSFTGIFGPSTLGPNHTYSIVTAIKEIHGTEFRKIP